jgi:hypothetical protein
VAEVLRLDEPAVGQAVLDRRDADATRRLAVESGMPTLRQRAAALVAAGVTSSAEVLRVFGLPVAGPVTPRSAEGSASHHSTATPVTPRACPESLEGSAEESALPTSTSATYLPTPYPL